MSWKIGTCTAFKYPGEIPLGSSTVEKQYKNHTTEVKQVSISVSKQSPPNSNLLKMAAMTGAATWRMLKQPQSRCSLMAKPLNTQQPRRHTGQQKSTEGPQISRCLQMRVHCTASEDVLFRSASAIACFCTLQVHPVLAPPDGAYYILFHSFKQLTVPSLWNTSVLVQPV